MPAQKLATSAAGLGNKWRTVFPREPSKSPLVNRRSFRVPLNLPTAVYPRPAQLLRTLPPRHASETFGTSETALYPRDAAQAGSPLRKPLLYSDWAHPLPHLRGDWAHSAHICTGTGPIHICTGTGPSPAHICTGTGPTPRPHPLQDWAHPVQHLHWDRAHKSHICTCDHAAASGVLFERGPRGSQKDTQRGPRGTRLSDDRYSC